MKITELKQKSAVELKNLLAESREELRRLRFLAAAGEFKSVRQIRELRQTIARILTLLKK